MENNTVKQSTVQMGCQIKEDLWVKLNAFAKEAGVPKRTVISAALEKFIKEKTKG